MSQTAPRSSSKAEAALSRLDDGITRRELAAIILGEERNRSCKRRDSGVIIVSIVAFLILLLPDKFDVSFKINGITYDKISGYKELLLATISFALYRFAIDFKKSSHYRRAFRSRMELGSESDFSKPLVKYVVDDFNPAAFSHDKKLEAHRIRIENVENLLTVLFICIVIVVVFSVTTYGLFQSLYESSLPTAVFAFVFGSSCGFLFLFVLVCVQALLIELDLPLRVKSTEQGNGAG
ncbi:MAG: hypothetical protein E5V85_11725 [Mesorhizobium sp.]|nr:MAG: hypothetical protein E5V85_11725 [Mesorhizobium sp.]